MPRPSFVLVLTLCAALVLSACAPTVQQILPTDRPTITPTPTATNTRTPSPRDVTPTATVTRPPATPTGGPSPTPLLGPTRTPDPRLSPTAVLSANAPRIEFFTSDVQAVAPGSAVTLFWSTRGVDGATVYRLDPTGARNQLWNVPPDGSLTVSTFAGDRGQIDFLITVGEGTERTEQQLTLPLSCPVSWFFVPPPADCPDTEPVETQIIEQPFVRGRMLFIAERDQVYALVNDGFDPAWIAFNNRYNPDVDPEILEGFPVPPGRVQPRAELGFVWRGSDAVRSRLGLGTQESFAYDGFLQTVQQGENSTLYVSSSDGTVLQIEPEGSSWSIISL
ncbi:MAG: hypothetical protein AAF125_15760, partial [Chloroflexota bacterium]